MVVMEKTIQHAEWNIFVMVSANESERNSSELFLTPRMLTENDREVSVS